MKAVLTKKEKESEGFNLDKWLKDKGFVPERKVNYSIDDKGNYWIWEQK